MREASRTAVSVFCLCSSHLQLPNYVTHSAGHFVEMQSKNLGGFRLLIQVLWYLDKYLLDCWNADAVVVVDELPAMAAKIAMSDRRTKVAFFAMSAIKQRDLRNAIGGALQHGIIIWYMLEADQTEHGVTAATLDTQEEWVLRGILLWVLDSNRGHEGHQKMHAAEAAQELIVSEVPVDEIESTAPKPVPTLPKHLKKTAQVVPTRGAAARKGTRSSSRMQSKGKGKESDKTEESDDDDGNEEEEYDPEQVVETQQKRKRASASHFDASTDDSGKDQPKKEAKTAASATAEFKPPSRSGAQQSPGTVASPSGGSPVARILNSGLAKVGGPKKK